MECCNAFIWAVYVTAVAGAAGIVPALTPVTVVASTGMGPAAVESAISVAYAVLIPQSLPYSLPQSLPQSQALLNVGRPSFPNNFHSIVLIPFMIPHECDPIRKNTIKDTMIGQNRHINKYNPLTFYPYRSHSLADLQHHASGARLPKQRVLRPQQGGNGAIQCMQSLSTQALHCPAQLTT